VHPITVLIETVFHYLKLFKGLDFLQFVKLHFMWLLFCYGNQCKWQTQSVYLKEINHPLFHKVIIFYCLKSIYCENVYNHCYIKSIFTCDDIILWSFIYSATNLRTSSVTSTIDNPEDILYSTHFGHLKENSSYSWLIQLVFIMGIICTYSQTCI